MSFTTEIVMCVCVCVCVCACVHACVHVHVCMHVCMCMRVPACMRLSKPKRELQLVTLWKKALHIIMQCFFLQVKKAQEKYHTQNDKERNKQRKGKR